MRAPPSEQIYIELDWRPRRHNYNLLLNNQRQSCVLIDAEMRPNSGKILTSCDTYLPQRFTGFAECNINIAPATELAAWWLASAVRQHMVTSGGG